MPTTPWKDIKARSKLTPAQKRRVEKRVERTLAEIELRQLREALEVTQVEMARRLKVTQVAVSRLERRPNLRLSTLAAYLQALGGRLEVRAVLPGREVILTHLATGAK